MNALQKFNEDIKANHEVLRKAFDERGWFNLQPNIMTMQFLKDHNHDAFVEMLSLMYGDEFDEWYNTANADGEGAERVLNSTANLFSAILSPANSLNAALGGLFGGGSNVTSQSIESMNATIVDYQEEVSRYRTMAIIAIVVCLAIGVFIILN